MDSILAKYSAFVKEQIDFSTRSALKYNNRDDHARADQYSYRASMFSELLKDLEDISKSTSHLSNPNPLTLTPDEIHDLPEELIQELSVSDSDRRDFLIIDLINKNGGVSTIDKLLIGIYRQTGEIEKRAKITARLYRMAKKGLIYPHPVKKGVYGTSNFDKEEIDLNDNEENNQFRHSDEQTLQT